MRTKSGIFKAVSVDLLDTSGPVSVNSILYDGIPSK